VAAGELEDAEDSGVVLWKGFIHKSLYVVDRKLVGRIW